MKKTLVVVFIIIALAGVLISADMAGFIDKANAAGKNLKIKEQQCAELNKQNNFIMQKINTLKAGEGQGMWLQKFIKSLELGYYLRQGNNYAYKTNALDKEIKDLKEEYFTYSSLIIAEYDKIILECIRTKCQDLKNNYEDREKWISNIKDYEDILQIDVYAPGTVNNPDKQAAEDLKEYLNKKLIQAEERIYILQDEKNIGKAVKEAGIKIQEKEMDEITAKIKELEKIREEIEEKLKETTK